MTMTSQQVNELRELVAQDFSAGRIAVMLGVSRNAVIGKIKRLRLNWPLDKNRHQAPPKTPPAPIMNVEVQGEPCLIMDLSNETCRWPLWHNDGPHFYCGRLDADQKNGCPYCRKHRRIAYAGAGR